MIKHEVVIIGAGPSGIGAAIELKIENIDFIIIEKSVPGGKVNIAPRVDNYPGFKEIPGPDLAFEFYKRLKNAGIKIVPEEVTSLSKKENFIVTTNENIYESKYVIICSGTKERKLGLEGEDKLLGHGLSYCALCDGHFFKDKVVLVAGGGNSALKEAIYLSNIVKTLYLIHRREEFRGSTSLVNTLKEKNNVKIFTPYIPTKLLYDDILKGVIIKNVKDQSEMVLNVDGFFPLVGQIPNSTFVPFSEIKSESNNIIVDKNKETSITNLFAAGDVLNRDIRQIYLSEYDGKVVAKEIIKRIKENG